METDSLLRKMPTRLLERAGRYLVGVILLFAVVVLWTTSNFITNRLETGDDSWNKPFLITYLSTASFTFYLLPTAWRYKRGELTNERAYAEYEPLPQTDSARRQPSRPSVEQLRTSDEIPRRSASLTRTLPQASPRAPVHSLEFPASSPGDSTTANAKLSIRETAQIAAWWSAVWFIANWAVNASLAWTSVASVTILSGTSGFFTLALGALCRVEVINNIKFSAVLMSFIGVVLVTRSDSTISSTVIDTPARPILGDCAALLSASFYAVYVILLKVRVGDEDRADMQMMLGFAGLFNTVCLIPMFPILHYLGWETFELPPSREAWIICAINGCITLSSDYLYVLAMLKTTPMVVTVGISMTIPISLVVTMILNPGYVPPLMVWAGATLVCAGFGQLGVEGYVESKRQAAQEAAAHQDHIPHEVLSESQ